MKRETRTILSWTIVSGIFIMIVIAILTYSTKSVMSYLNNKLSLDNKDYINMENTYFPINNEDSINDLISVCYPTIRFERLKEINGSIYNINGEDYLTYYDITALFRVECIRENYRGNYYIVFKLYNGGCAFICMNHDLIITDILICPTMISKDDFVENISEQTTRSDILNSDSNSILSYFSHTSLQYTGHLVKEGVIVIFYDESSVVKSWDFVATEDIPGLEDNLFENFAALSIPYILPQDKQF